ncbi:MAG TPA: hypothetical protein VF918_22155 [Anaerolineales bacterium]
MIFDNSVICPVFIGRENDLQLLDHLRKGLEQVFSEYNRATDGTTSLEYEFLELIAVRNS